MITAAIAMFAAQGSPPIPVAPAKPQAEVADFVWQNQTYALKCDVIDKKMRRETFDMTLSDDDGLSQVRISGDDQMGLNTIGFVPVQNSVPNYYIDPEKRRFVLWDGPDSTTVVVFQEFDKGKLRSTSFQARYSSRSTGLADTEMLMGYCSPANDTEEVVQ